MCKETGNDPGPTKGNPPTQQPKLPEPRTFEEASKPYISPNPTPKPSPPEEKEPPKKAQFERRPQQQSSVITRPKSEGAPVGPQVPPSPILPEPVPLDPGEYSIEYEYSSSTYLTDYS